MKDKYNTLYDNLIFNEDEQPDLPLMTNSLSIYHIENDLDCKVLKFGKEICVAIAGEDTTIYLRKGRHKLTFVSLENSQDSYSIVYEVPDNGIEDFIDVTLSIIMGERLEKERREYELEQQRVAALEQKRREEEKQKLLLLEQKRREEEERLEKERLEKEQQAFHKKQESIAVQIKTEIKNKVQFALESHAEMDSVDDYEYNGSRWIKDTNDLYYLAKDGVRITDSIYKSVSRFSEGLSRVHNGRGFGYVDECGDTIINCQYAIAGHFHRGHTFVYSNSQGHGKINNDNTFTAIYESARPLLWPTFGLKTGKPPRLIGLYLLAEPVKEDNQEVKLTVINLSTREEIYSLLCRQTRKGGHIEYPFGDDIRKYICKNEEYIWGDTQLAGRVSNPDFGSGSDYFRNNGICYLGSITGFINSYGFYIDAKGVRCPSRTGILIQGNDIIDEDGYFIGPYIEEKKTFVEDASIKDTKVFLKPPKGFLDLTEKMIAISKEAKKYSIRIDGKQTWGLSWYTFREAELICKEICRFNMKNANTIEIVDMDTGEVVLKYK